MLPLETTDPDDDFYVCPQHWKTGGYETCCLCKGDRLCTEAKEGTPLAKDV